jgi:FtsH-binding integral membrane protein
MYNMRNNRSFGSSRYQYQTLPYGYEGTQASGLISKVMGLLAVSFLSAAVGTFVGFFVLPVDSFGTYFMIVIAGFIVLIALQFMIQKPGINLFLLYLFTFLEGMSLAPIVSAYASMNSNILGQAFLITAIVALGLSFYAWTTKRDFTRIGDYLFVGLILLLVVSIIGLFFHSSLVVLAISFFGVAIFSGYVLYYVQRARTMADTMPNAIGLTVSLFLTLLNLFLYILQILAILQGGNRRR